jgi:hypothetical protein
MKFKLHLSDENVIFSNIFYIRGDMSTYFNIRKDNSII